jgi:hypothetical protein
MRLFATIALLGTFVSIGNLRAQSLAEHGAAAAGATIGTAAGKPISNAVTKIFGQVDDQTKSASKTDVKVVRPVATGEKPSPAGPAAGGAEALPPGPGAPSAAAGTGSSGSSTRDELTEPSSAARRSKAESRRTAARIRRQHESAAAAEATFTGSAPATQTEPLIPAEPVVKEPTAEEVAGIRIGASDQDVVAALGVPASRVTIPDDDGHLRESYQYWAKGSQIGTVRLDNGVVVKVEARRF